MARWPNLAHQTVQFDLRLNSKIMVENNVIFVSFYWNAQSQRWLSRKFLALQTNTVGDLWPERSKVLAITLKSSLTHIAIHLNNSPTCTLFFAFSLRVKLLLCSVFSLCCLSLVKLGSFFIQKTCWTLTGRSFPGFPSVVNLCGWFWGNPGDTGLLLELGSTQTWRRLTDGKTQWPPPPLPITSLNNDAGMWDLLWVDSELLWDEAGRGSLCSPLSATEGERGRGGGVEVSGLVKGLMGGWSYSGRGGREGGSFPDDEIYNKRLDGTQILENIYGGKGFIFGNICCWVIYIK